MVTKTRRTLTPAQNLQKRERRKQLAKERGLAPPTKKKFGGKTFDLGSMEPTKATAEAKAKSFNARGFQARIAKIKPFVSRGKTVTYGVWIS